jgi:formylmethanofuran dehydrogenase subunit A
MDYLNGHPELSCDVGQVLFGPATTLSADSPAQYILGASSARWLNIDVELETGCGVVPHHYRERNAVAALQWAVGLELFLLSTDPWQIALSTDHPNGGAFTAYPRLIRLLMDRAYRDDQLREVNQKWLAGSTLLDGVGREYTINEIAIITRAGPARRLGLGHKGHLGPGADADITVYQRHVDPEVMFSTPYYVLKSGALVLEEGQLRRAPAGRRLHVRPEYDPLITREFEKWLDRFGTVHFVNYGVGQVREAPITVGVA